MNDKVLVSVLMTAYNRERYIAEAIESVLRSTYGNFELIIVDDISKDNTLAIAKKYADKDARVRVYQNEVNLGDYPNRNKAASYAKGKYLKYVDADDYIYPWGLELLVQMMEEYPDAGWGLCSLEQDAERPFPFALDPGDAFRYHYFGPGIFHKAPLSSIIKKTAFEAVGGFSGKKHLGDFELWHLLALREKIVLMPGAIVWYREHDEQQSKDNRTDERIPFKYSVAACHFFAHNKSIPLQKEEILKIRDGLRKNMLKLVSRKFLKGQWKLATDLKKMMKDDQYDFKQI